MPWILAHEARFVGRTLGLRLREGDERKNSTSTELPAMIAIFANYIERRRRSRACSGRGNDDSLMDYEDAGGLSHS